MVNPVYDTTHIRQLLEAVSDPEIPVLSVNDLGIIRDVRIHAHEIEVVITPTYSGCPAMDMIAENILRYLHSCGYDDVKVTTVLSPAWTTDWMTETGKRKLEEYGIAPPNKLTRDSDAPRRCPRCGSADTRLISQFGSTACKALYQCNACKEPFDYFKCH